MKILINRGSSSLIFYLLSIIILSGCSAWRYGLTKDRSFNRYLLVDSEKENFGYKRLEYIKGYRSSFAGYLKTYGEPEMIYEFEDSEGREGVKLYYMQKGKVYELIEANWQPSSIYPKIEREITDEERAVYSNTLKLESSN